MSDNYGTKKLYYLFISIITQKEMQKSLKLLLPLILSLTIIFLTLSPSPSLSSPPQKQGNLPTEMIQTLKNLIDNSTELYRRYRLVDMANYISAGMKKSYGDQWQVFVFGENTEHCSFSANTVTLEHWAVWEQFGLYDLCYVVYRTKSCLKSGDIVQEQKI